MKNIKIIIGVLLFFGNVMNISANIDQTPKKIQEEIIEQMNTLNMDFSFYDPSNKELVNIEPIYPKQYHNQTFPDKGVNKGYKPNTLRIGGHEFDFEDLSGNTGAGEDFVALQSVLDQNKVVKTGMNQTQAFFGHYYDLTGDGVFNAIVDLDLQHVGTEVIVTDSEGYSKGYEVTQIIEYEQLKEYNYYYDEYPMSLMAFFGNGEDVVYIQYCRWDISMYLGISSFSYRIW